MKTIMVISGTPSETSEMALYEAKQEGYRCVFCTDQPDEKSGRLADVIYRIRLDDTDALFAIAEKEHADGIISMSTKAMIPAAAVCRRLGMPGNSPESLEPLISKDAFRELALRAGVFHPGFVVPASAETIEEECAALHFPVIVKPAQGSSSFGQTIVSGISGLKTAYEIAVRESWNRKALIEEYIPQPSLRAVEIDVFVAGDEILWDGVRDSYRVEAAPLRPVYDVYPASLAAGELDQMRHTIAALLREAGVRLGEYDIEGYFTEEGEFFVIEINPRPAGYYNPQHIFYYCGVNLTRLLVTTAVGDWSCYDRLRTQKRTKNNILAYSVFSPKEGVLDHVYIHPSLVPKMVEQRFPLGRQEGHFVQDILTAIRPISILVFAFNSKDELERVRSSVDTLIYPVLRD